jgi:hypothetical protein
MQNTVLRTYPSRFNSIQTSFRGALRQRYARKKDWSYLHKGLITYNITQKGRDTVQKLRDSLVRDIIPVPEDLSRDIQ